MSPCFLLHFPLAPKSEGYCFRSAWLLYGREPNGARAEPGKEKTRRVQYKDFDSDPTDATEAHQLEDAFLVSLATSRSEAAAAGAELPER